MPKCLTCGQDITPASAVKPWNNNMFPYVLATSGKSFGVMNNDAEDVTIPASDTKPEIKLVREDVYIKRQQMSKITGTSGGLTEGTGSDKPKAPAPPAPPTV